MEQFPSKGLGVYYPWREGDEEPTGICMNCGAYCFDHEATCSESCYDKLMAYMNTGVL